PDSDDPCQVRRLAVTVACLALLAPASAISAGSAKSWADAQIRVVTSHGLMGGSASSFRPDDALTAGDLSDLVSCLTGTPRAPIAAPAAPGTIAGLDSPLVRGLGLGRAAKRFTDGTRTAGLAPPARFGTEVVARLLGFRTDHPRAQESLELAPGET